MTVAELDMLKGLIPLNMPPPPPRPPEGLIPVEPPQAPVRERAPLEAQQEVLRLQQERPTPGSPKIWQRILAGALGGAAGYVNSAGKPGLYVDPQQTRAATQGIMYPNYARNMANWRDELEAAKQAAGMEMEQRQLKLRGQEAEARIGASGAARTASEARTRLTEKQINAPSTSPRPTRESMAMAAAGGDEAAAQALKLAYPPKVAPLTAAEKIEADIRAREEQGKRLQLQGKDLVVFSLTGKIPTPAKPATPAQGALSLADRQIADKHDALRGVEEWRTEQLTDIEIEAFKEEDKPAARAVVEKHYKAAKETIEAEFRERTGRPALMPPVRPGTGGVPGMEQIGLTPPVSMPLGHMQEVPTAGASEQIPLSSPQVAQPAEAPSGVPPEVQAALDGQADGRYTLDDGSVWEIRNGEITPGQ